MFEAIGSNKELPVGAGIDTFLTQDGKLIDYATDVNIRQDFEVQGIRTLAFHGDRGFKSMGYSANIDIGSYVIREPNAKGALDLPAYTPDGKFQLNKAGGFDFVLSDVNELIVLETALWCKLATSDSSYPNNAMNTRKTAWKSRCILPGLQTS